MSKSINVNPDHYKVAGRERPGDAIVRDSKKQRDPGTDKIRERWEQRQQERERLKGKR
jgi:hypothetical protein